MIIKINNAQEEFDTDIVQTLLDDAEYGIQWNEDSPIPIRIGNMALHRTLPIQSKIKRCMLLDDGTPYGYIDPNDYTKYTTGETVDYTGAHGQWMVEIPEYWFDSVTVEVDGANKRKLILYPNYKAGAKHSPKCYISAAEACSNDSSSDSVKKLFSICTANITYNEDGSVNANTLTYTTNAENYRGGNRDKTTHPDNSIKSLLGRPITSLTRSDFRSRAAARGAGWSQQYWTAYMSVVRLYVVEYCSFNVQASFNSNKTTDGYAQGGLGVGVSEVNSTSWSNFNAYNPFVPCGVTKRLGNSSGYVEFKYGAGEFQSTAMTVQVPSYRGIENLFAHIWKFTDGINIYGDSTNNTTAIYTCDDITKFTDNTSTNYVLRTHSAVYGTEGYIKNWLWDDYGDFIPLTQGGSSSSYLYDYSWFQNAGWKVLLSGGLASDGSLCGLFAFRGFYGSSYSWAAYGGRLYYIPTA